MIVPAVLPLLIAAPPVAVEVACPDVDTAELERVLSLELRRPIDDAAAARGSVRCSGGQAVLSSTEDGTARERTVDLTATAPVARARLLALSLAELLVPAPPPAPPPPAPPVVTAPPPQQPRATPFRAVAFGHARAFSAGFMTAGAGVRGTVAAGQRLAVQADVSLDRGHPDAEGDLGTVTLDVLSGGAAVLARAHVGRFAVGAGPGVRGGAVRLRGRPGAPRDFQGRSATAFTFGPTLVASVAPPLVGALALELTVEAGTLLRPVVGYAGERRATAVEGSWIGVTLGAGIGR